MIKCKIKEQIYESNIIEKSISSKIVESIYSAIIKDVLIYNTYTGYGYGYDTEDSYGFIEWRREEC